MKIREIKFRGKRADGKWVFGSHVVDANNNHLILSPLSDQSGHKFWDKKFQFNEVLPNTVGQSIGLTDKNGVVVYDGDIIQDHNGIGVIIWFQSSWGVASYAYGYNGYKSYTAVDSFYSNDVKEWCIIGSIIDNPFLLTKNEAK